MNDAVAADKRRKSGAALGPLHGLPVPIKDNIDTADAPNIRRDTGTPGRIGRRPNAPVAQSLFSRGSDFARQEPICTSLPYGITSNNAAFGPVRNPYNDLLIPGGSSGGTAAAIAARMCAAGLGNRHGWIGANTSCSVWHCRAASHGGPLFERGHRPHFAYSRYCRTSGKVDPGSGCCLTR